MKYLILIKIKILCLFFCFFLYISYPRTKKKDEIDINELYNKIIIIAKGMDYNTEYKCSNTLINHKKALYPYIEGIIKNIQNQEELEKIMNAETLTLLTIPAFEEYCNINLIIQTVPNLVKVGGIKKLGLNMIDNATELANLLKEFIAASVTEGKLIVIGKIIQKITGITFY